MGIKLKSTIHSLFAVLMISSISYAQEVPDTAPEDTPNSTVSEETVKSIRSNQFTLSYTKFVSEDCRIAIFSNKTLSNFIIKKFKKDHGVSFKDYLINQDQNLSNEKKSYNFNDFLQGETKKYSFLIEENNIIIGYSLKNKDSNSYSKQQSILEENIDCSEKIIHSF
jgi:hypothetical protein